MGRFSDFFWLTVVIWVIMCVAVFIVWNPRIEEEGMLRSIFYENGVFETALIVMLIIAIILSAIVIGVFVISDTNREIQEEQRVDKQRELEIQKQQKAEEEWKAKQDAAEKIAKPIRIALVKRIRALLRENTGEFFDAMEIQSGIGVITASEDYHFNDALRRACETNTAAEKGYLCKDKEIGYETTRRYYYYVDPNE